jgi:SAM-dependent methyltransferase
MMDNEWSIILMTTIIVLCCLYLLSVAFPPTPKPIDTRALDLNLSVEGFESGPTAVDQRVDDQCYDEFYAKVYDALVQPIARAPLEVKVALEWMVGQRGHLKEQLRVLDLGCGTGLHVELFAQQGVASVVGIDKSAAMIAEGIKRFPHLGDGLDSGLGSGQGDDPDKESKNSLQVGDATDPSIATPGQFDLITMFYFTIYMIPDRVQMLKNIFNWLAPGGTFVVHIVNKLKFDAQLESCSPWVAFSPQKYSEERLTKSEVFFDKFDYTGDFQLHGSRAMYEEIFKFKDGRVRKHEQRLWMPNIADIVAEITSVGFSLQPHQDLTAAGLEYTYLMFFTKP